MTAEDPSALVPQRAAEMAEARGDYEEGEQLYLAAIAGYRAIGDTLGLGEALGLLATHARRGQRARTEQLMSEAIEVLEREPPSRELARIYPPDRELLSSDRNAECLGGRRRRSSCRPGSACRMVRAGVAVPRRGAVRVGRRARP
jgi:hypothetical protein